MEMPTRTKNSPSGLILLNDALSPVAFNATALQILAHPTDPTKIGQPLLFIRDKIKFRLLRTDGDGENNFVQEFISGRRKYSCRAFLCDCQGSKDGQVRVAILLDRPTHGAMALTGLASQFDLTPRELQTVGLLIEGLTSKQIGARMNISPNTVKAFLRIIMFKMKVSTRSGIVGKILESMPESD